MKIEITGSEMLKKEVKQASTSGVVYLPKDWIGDKVAIIRSPNGDTPQTYSGEPTEPKQSTRKAITL